MGGRGFQVNVGERTVQEQCLLGREREQVNFLPKTAMCQAGQF